MFPDKDAVIEKWQMVVDVVPDGMQDARALLPKKGGADEPQVHESKAQLNSLPEDLVNIVLKGTLVLMLILSEPPA
jgi:hypothetical protein